jgi:hypothetical protein
MITLTIMDRPVEKTGTKIAPRGAALEETLGIVPAMTAGSGGSNLKKLSAFFECSLLSCLIQPIDRSWF